MRKLSQFAISASLLTILSLGLSGCAQDGSVNKQTLGTGIGAAVGGIVGSMFGGGSGRLLMIGAGAVAGGMAGNYFGKEMDDQDKHNMSGALSTVPAGQQVGWKDKKGAEYTFKPTDEAHTQAVMEEKNGHKTKKYLKCRNYVQTVTIDGKQQEAHGMACLHNGQWQLVS